MPDLWNDMSVQFPRLISEMKAAGFFDTNEGPEVRGLLNDLCVSMDLEYEDVMHIVDIADDAWEMIKINLIPDTHPVAILMSKEHAEQYEYYDYPAGPPNPSGESGIGQSGTDVSTW